MPIISGDCRSLFLGERQELRCKLANRVAVERDVVRAPNATEEREQQYRVFRRLAKGFGLFHEQTRLFRAVLVSGAAYPLTCMRHYEGELKLDLLATSAALRQGRDLVESARELITASTNADRSSDRCPALPQNPAAFSISPASVQ